MVPESVRRLLPAPREIEQISDDVLVALACEIFDLLPEPKKALGKNAHSRVKVLSLLNHAYCSCISKAENLDGFLLEILDPKNNGLVMASNFADGFPFILRLVQVHDQEEKKLQQRMKYLNEVSFELAADAEMRNSESLASHDYPKTSNDNYAAVAPSKTPRLPLRSTNSTRSLSPSKMQRSPLKSSTSTRSIWPARNLSPTRQLGGQRKTPTTATTDSPLSIAETARLRQRSIPSTKAQSMRKSSLVQKEVGDDRTKAEQLRIKLKGVKRILKEADINGDGVVTWEELRGKAPGLPEDPKHMGIRIDPNHGVDLPLMVNILYPGEAKVLIHQHEEEERRKFVLPQDKRNEIIELFRVMTGGGIRSSMGSLKLYHGLREVLLLDYSEAAAAYWQLMVLHLPPPSAGANCGVDNHDQNVTLERFTDWYIDNFLTDKFKYENFDQNKGTRKKK